jgi:hypothetical protein
VFPDEVGSHVILTVAVAPVVVGALAPDPIEYSVAVAVEDEGVEVGAALNT